jgi:hypothetical protein
MQFLLLPFLNFYSTPSGQTTLTIDFSRGIPVIPDYSIVTTDRQNENETAFKKGSSQFIKVWPPWGVHPCGGIDAFGLYSAINLF